jgi:hypothetical protein
MFEKRALQVAQQLDPPCAHRGLGEEKAVLCKACPGNVRVRPFACEVHKRCSVKRPVGKLKVCTACQERIPPPGVDTVGPS